MPNHADACKLSIVNSMLFEDKARIPVIEQRWLAIDLIPAQVEEFQANVKRALIKCLKIQSTYWYHRTASVADEMSDFAILEKPSRVTPVVTESSLDTLPFFRHIYMCDLT
jgi:hypothetical protein